MRASLRHCSGTVWLGCFAAALITTPAAAVDSFRFRQLASSQNGAVQIIELAEVDGKNGQHEFSGLTLTVTDRHGVTNSFKFPNDLPNAGTANRHVMIKSWAPGFPGVARTEDYELPYGFFLPTDGGTIEISGNDRWTFDSIPTDGTSLRRGGEVRQGTVQNFAGNVWNCCGPIFPEAYVPGTIDLTIVTVVEFYNPSLDHYFITASEPDVEALVSRRIPGWEQRIEPLGHFFSAASLPVGYGSRQPDGSYEVQAQPVCRFYIPPGSHFFSASADECNAVEQQHPEFVLETRAAFHIVLPDPVTGECPPDIGVPASALVYTPIYRLWNNKPDTNHRFTRWLSERADMIAKGWISEGYGPLGVVMCAFDWI